MGEAFLESFCLDASEFFQDSFRSLSGVLMILSSMARSAQDLRITTRSSIPEDSLP